MKNRYIPVTYNPQKAEKSKVNYKLLYKADLLAFDPLIGYLTNLSTTLYEIQSKYPADSKEYTECETRLKLCCYLQSSCIDAAKGIAFDGIPKHWIRPTKITDAMRETLSDEEIEKIEFNNKLCIGNLRPYFMRYLYPIKNKAYNEFWQDVDRMSILQFGKTYAELTEQEQQTEEYKKIQNFIDTRSPLLDTNGTMNRICRYMEGAVKQIKKDRNGRCANTTDEIFKCLFDDTEPTDMNLLDFMEAKYDKYTAFKREKRLVQSEFNSYDQFYWALKNECLEEISNNLRECANLAVYVCYKLFPKRAKDFCWDCFGDGIFENVLHIQQTRQSADFALSIPQRSADGNILYLGEKYKYNSFVIGGNDDDDI